MAALRQLSKQLRTVLPGPSPSLLMGNIPQIKAEAPKFGGSGLRVIDSWFKQYGDTFVMNAGPIPMVYTRDVEIMKMMAQNDPEQYTKMTWDMLMKDLVGSSIVFTEGTDWYRKRKLYRNAFKKGALESFLPSFHESAQELAQAWKLAAQKDNLKITEKVDIPAHLNRLTMDVIGRVGFGYNFECQKNPGKSTVANDWTAVLELQNETQNSLLYFLMGLDRVRKYTKVGKDFKQAKERLMETVLAVIAQRRTAKTSSDQRKDLLQFLMDSQKEEDTKDVKEMDDRELISEVMLFFLAGQETTSNLLSWTLYRLALNPEVKAKVLEELKTVGAPGVGDESAPDWGVINNLPYMTQVLKETLRLHPAVSGIPRMTIHETKFGEYLIPPQTPFLLQVYSVHRDPRHYPDVDVEKFDPENFSPEKVKNRHQYAWAPFSVGPRNCIGMQFAMVESRTVLSYILPRFDFTPLTEPQTIERGVLAAGNMQMRVKQLS